MKTVLALSGLLLLAAQGMAQEAGETIIPVSQTLLEPGANACFSCCEARPSCSRFWASSEYLLWWVKDTPMPVPVVTTGPATPNLTPVLAQPGTVILIGGHDIDEDVHSGGRFTFGCWLGDCQQLGTEASYFFLGSRAARQQVSSSGQPGSLFLALPFFDVTVPGESSTRIAFPGTTRDNFGGTAILTVRDWLQGAEWNVTGNLARSNTFRLDLLAGFRFLELQENLSLFTSSPDVVVADIFHTLDRFETGNWFYGCQLGLRGEWHCGNLFAQGLAKVALGNMHETVNINGQLVTNDIGPLQTFPGGYLALPSNIGRQSSDRFAVVPEVGLNLGWQMDCGIRLTIGYSFLYLSDVARPGDQINRAINPSQAPAITNNPPVPANPAQPAPLFRHTDFWAQGLNFGLAIPF